MMRISDRISGVFLALLGAAAFWGGSRLPPVPGQQVGPSAFPMVVGAGLVIVGILIALHIGRSFEEQAEAELAEHSQPDPEAELYEKRRQWLALLPPCLLVFYYLVSERLGFIITAAIMIGVLAWAFNARRRLILPVALGGAVFIHLVFFKVLRVPLAPGLLPMPW
ncbi:MAG: tripartite tricarboxylate transporter TctB family protein [Beijerinckiaceae bacterium]|nr:tripartite tricarboxylate transporter TctB family protein [Beijerinckiaceae bacterium]MCZ8299949.1 tripartite tricarboxylate transporter TctB family protein [Beijerinckiaceae bacterium]